MIVHAICKFLEIRNDAIIACTELSKSVGAVARHISRTAKHGKSNSAFGLGFVVALVPPCGHTIFAKADSMRGAHDPVAQRQMRQLKRLEERISRHRSGWDTHGSSPFLEVA
jgi:hypothetical protein